MVKVIVLCALDNRLRHDTTVKHPISKWVVESHATPATAPEDASGATAPAGSSSAMAQKYAAKRASHVA
jgi:hypothetical protein